MSSNERLICVKLFNRSMTKKQHLNLFFLMPCLALIAAIINTSQPFSNDIMNSAIIALLLISVCIFSILWITAEIEAENI